MISAVTQPLTFGDHSFAVSRPYRFGIVIEGTGDYLHDVLQSADHKESFLKLIEDEKLVVCKNVDTRDPTRLQGAQ